MSDTGLIGPNAILQLLPVLDRAGGPALRGQLLQAADVTVPDGTTMIDEAPAVRLHQQLRRALPDRAAALLSEAGTGTADYILAHRIPRAAQILLKALPAPLAARLLAKAIDRHAWTFAGSGGFTVISPICFDICDNPVVRGELADRPICAWHAAVFARLYQVLVHGDVVCRETACCAQGARACRFELTRGLS